jgi:hypothetical protein
VALLHAFDQPGVNSWLRALVIVWATAIPFLLATRLVFSNIRKVGFLLFAILLVPAVEVHLKCWAQIMLSGTCNFVGSRVHKMQLASQLAVFGRAA